MARDRDEFYRYGYLSDLCTEYRRAAIASGTRRGTVAAMYHPVRSVSLISESTSNMLDSFDNFGQQVSSLARQTVSRGIERETTVPDEERQTTSGCGEQEEKQTFRTFINDVGDSQEDASLQDFDLTIGKNRSIKSASNQLFLDKALGIEGIDQDILNYLEECWDCDLKVQFDWQLKPLNILIGLEGFLDDIEDLLDMLNDMLDPAKFLANFCDFFDGFNWICPPDLVALLLALAMLIKKYMMLAIDINLDWTALIGPILKWIIDAIVSFLQQIVQILVAPLDCVIGALQSIQSVLDAADELGDTAIAAANYLTEGVGGMFEGETRPSESIIASKGNPTYSDIYQKEKEGREERASIGEQFKGVRDELKTNPNADFEQTETDAKISALRQTQQGGTQVAGFKLARKVVDETARRQIQEDKNKFSIPTGISIGVNDTFDSFFDERKKKKRDGEAVFDLSKITIFKTSILAVQSARQYIVDFFNQIMFALTSLNAMFTAKLSLNVESLGLILLLLDLIKLIKMLLNLKHMNCQTLEDNPELVLEALKQAYPRMKFELGANNTIERTDSDLYNVKVPLDSCSLESGRSPEETERARALKESVQRISGLKLR